MISKAVDIRGRATTRRCTWYEEKASTYGKPTCALYATTALRVIIALVLVLALSVALVPQVAWGYYNRGSVSIALGATEVSVAAGSTVSVTALVTPASDEQTIGCGMAMCPQNCASTCADENGQCRCAGSDYDTYYPSVAVSSSNASVAVATYQGNAVTVYGKAEGEATITVRASLRQFTDAEATFAVRVDPGSLAAGGTSTGVEVDVPQEAQVSEPDDRADVVDKTIMNRLIRNVRITDECVPADHLRELAGTDAEVTFWAGDTYYHPAYSLTFMTSEFEAADVAPIDVHLSVSSEPTGELYQALSGLDGFLVVDFAERGELFAPAMVYVEADGVLSDDDAIALFSWDEDAKAFVREQAEASMSGGYATVSVQEGKLYVVSKRDLTSEANSIIEGGSTAMEEMEEGCGPDDNATTDVVSWAPAPIVYVIAGIVILAVACVCVIAITRRRRKR